MAEAPKADDKTVANSATEDEMKFAIEGEEDEKLTAKNGESDDDDEGEELDADRERIREARRIERRERRVQRAEAIKRDKGELDFLARRNQELEDRLAALEGRSHQEDARQIDDRLSATVQQHRQAEAALADAIAKGDGQLANQALRVRDAAVEENRKLQAVKARISDQPRRENAPDPAVTRLATEWVEDNDWYDPSGRDADSNVVQAIDKALASEGMDPRTEEFWDELDARVRRALPNRFKPARARKPGPPVSGGRESTSTSGAKAFVVSKERVDAMKQSGAWDDPVRKAKQIRAYADFDKENSRR